MKDKILKEFQRDRVQTTSKLVKRFHLSRQAIHRHLKNLLDHGLIVRQGTGRRNSSYALNDPKTLKKIWGPTLSFKKTYSRKGLQEDSVFLEAKQHPKLLKTLSKNTHTLFHYGFTEILNNAIDHSQTHKVSIEIAVNNQKAHFIITDGGVGIFKNIQSKKKLLNEIEAIQDLLKGKQTTLPKYHSGEGIFFTSKAADYFTIESHYKKLIIDNRLHDIFLEDIRFRRGTRISFEISAQSQKKLDEIFRKFTNEEFQFNKSQVIVKLFQEGSEYISRSQAKRLLHALDVFQEIIIDFKGVPTVGQGFVDEIFRVFKTRHPKTRITPIHCHENVLFMINRSKTVSSESI